VYLWLMTVRRALAVHLFKPRISDSTRMIIVSVLIKKFKHLLRKYKFKIQVQTKTFIIEILGLHFQYFPFFAILGAFTLSFAFVKSFNFIKSFAFTIVFARSSFLRWHFARLLWDLLNLYISNNRIYSFGL